MKRSFIYLFALLAASTLAVSCQKDELPEAVASTFSRLSPFKGEVISDNASKTTLTNANQVYWQDNDQVKINGTTYAASPDATDATKADFLGAEATPDPDPIEGFYYAFFPASHYYNGANGIMPASSDYNAAKFDLPMYAKSSSSTLQFHNTFADFRLKLKGTSLINRIVVESLGETALTGPYTVNESNVAVMSGTSPENKVFTLNCNNTALTSDGVTFHIPLPAGQHTLRFRIVTSEGYICERVTNANVSISASKYYTVEMTPVFAGTFQLSSTLNVRFAPGNLKYDGSQYTFADPFDYPTENLPTNIQYFTWDEATTNGGVFDVQVDGRLEQYQVLGDSQWYAVCFGSSRPGATVGTKTDARYVKVKVSDLSGVKNGLLLIPDGFNWPSVVTAPTSTNINSQYSDFSTQYTQADLTTLINAGCVFLPAAGFVPWNQTLVTNSGVAGNYWSKTESWDDGFNYSSEAYILLFNNMNCVRTYASKSHKLSLRLVQAL